jgi:hypothetical protein
MGVQIQEQEKLNLFLSIAIELLGFQAERKTNYWGLLIPC